MKYNKKGFDKMKNSKKIFSFILCLSIVFIMLSGVCTVSAATNEYYPNTSVPSYTYITGHKASENNTDYPGAITYVYKYTDKTIMGDEWSDYAAALVKKYDFVQQEDSVGSDYILTPYIRKDGVVSALVILVIDLKTMSVSVTYQIPPSYIVLEKNEITLTEDKSEKLNAKIYPIGCTANGMNWVVSDTDIASVTADGVVKAKKIGRCKVYVKSAYDENIYSVCSVNVVENDITDVLFSNKEYTYDGTEKSVAVTGTLPTGAKVEYTNEKATNAGTYNATAKITCEGYNDITLNATLKINPKNLTVSGLTAQNKKYDGTDTANLSGGSLNGKISGDDVNADIPATGKFANANAGNNIAVSIDNITLTGTKKDNYTLTQPTGLKANIEKADITVRANDKQMLKGGAIPKLDYAIIGDLFGDDKITGELKVNTDGKTVGDFDITQGTLAVSSNYKLTFEKGKLSVADKTPQNIMVADFGEKTYGDAAFAVSVTADAAANLTNYTFESDNTDVAEIAADGTITIKAAGEANITVKEPGNDEYAPFEKTVKLVVKKKAVTVTSVDIENKTAVLDGVLAEDAENATLDFDKITVEQGEAIDETTSNITLKNFVLKGDKAANYEITTESLPATTVNDNIVDITIAAENGVVTGAAKYIKGSSVTVTAAANSGYRFTGWYVDGEAVSTESTYTFTADNDVALTAKFERTRSSRGGGGGSSSAYTIKFDTNGGSELKNISVKSGQSIGTITEPKKDGYVFTGWYSDKELTKPYNKDEKVTASAILYAGWKIDPVRQLILTIGKKDAAVFGQTKSNDVAPKIVNDRTMLPARFVAENLGAVVTWNAEKQEVTVKGKNAKDEDITILIYIGSDIAYVNDEQIKLDSPAFIENDRTYTPVRFISERLGASVEWNETDKTVTITK